MSIELTLITQDNDPNDYLHRKLIPVTEPEKQIPYLKAMVGVMKEHGGIGLTANQVGLEDRMFVMMINSDPSVKKQAYAQFVINPVIERVWPKKNMNPESCLSYPGEEVRVARPIDIMVSFHDGKSPRRMKLHGLDARVFLHEYDHCKGQCIVDKLKDLEGTGPDVKEIEEKYRKYVDNNKLS